jgi:hypothetical protein
MIMKRLFWVGWLVAALLLVALPAGAQGDDGTGTIPGGCNTDLADVYLLLGEAQGAWERADNAAAVTALAEARERLAEIEQACGGSGPQIVPTTTPTQVPEPTATTIPEDTVALFVTTSPTTRAATGLLAEAAQGQGVPLQVFENQRDFILWLDAAHIKGAIYGGPGVTSEALYMLRDLVEKGGRVLLLYDESWIPLNTLLQELFGVTLVADTFATAKNEDFIYPRTALPGWLQDYTIGIADPNGSRTAFFRAYLEVPQDWPGERGTALDDDSGEERLVYYANPTGSVIFWPVPVELGSGAPLFFFADEHVDYFYNRQVLFALVEYLLPDG